MDITPYVANLRAMVPHIPPAEQLREAARLLNMRLEEVDTQGTPAHCIAPRPHPLSFRDMQ